MVLLSVPEEEEVDTSGGNFDVLESFNMMEAFSMDLTGVGLDLSEVMVRPMFNELEFSAGISGGINIIGTIIGVFGQLIQRLKAVFSSA